MTSEGKRSIVQKDARTGIKDLEVIVQVTAIQSVLVQNKECHETADGDEQCRVTGADDCDDINKMKVKKKRKRVSKNCQA